jgi:hypothetical protein
MDREILSGSEKRLVPAEKKVPGSGLAIIPARHLLLGSANDLVFLRPAFQESKRQIVRRLER